MNLKDYDLYALNLLLHASERNLELKKLVEGELKRRMIDNNNFSREYLFDVTKIKNHAINIHFNPASEAYKKYGQYVTIDTIFTEDEKLEMVKNIFTKPPINTSGQIKAKALVTKDLTQEQINSLEKEGFHTSEILETQHM